MKKPQKLKKLYIGQFDLSSLMVLVFVIAVFIAAVVFAFWYNLTAEERILSHSSNDNHGETWDEVIESMRSDTYESMVFFDGERANKLLDSNNADKHRVSISEAVIPALRSHESLVHLHSHPGDSTFSDNDLCFPGRRGLRDNITTMVVVSPNYLYEMTLNDDGPWPSEPEVMTFLTELVCSDDSKDVYLYETTQAGMSGVCFNDRAMKAFAEHFNMRYEVTHLR